MIIVEGPDGAGKTTLIEKLRVEFDLPVAPRVVSKETEALVDLKTWTEQNVAQGWQPTLFDRHRLISEPIYGSIMRKTFERGFDDFWWMYNMNYMFYEHCRPLVIYCLPPYPVVRGNLIGDPDNEVILPKIRRIYAQYVAKAAADCAMTRAFVFDYTNPNFQSVFNLINTALEVEAHV